MVDGFQGATPQAKVKPVPSRSGPHTNLKFFATDSLSLSGKQAAFFYREEWV